MKPPRCTLAPIVGLLLAFGVIPSEGRAEFNSLASKTGNENLLTLGSDVPVLNPPTQLAESAPTLENFNKVFAELFGGQYVDLTKDDGLAKLTEFCQHETSNGLFAKLKVREKGFHGGVFLDPMVWNQEQIILVSARILYLEKGGDKGRRILFSKKDTKVLRCEILMVHFTLKGIFKSVERAIGTRQEM